MGHPFSWDCDFLTRGFFESPSLRWVAQDAPDDNGEFRFVLSHPFARKKAKGWGTEGRISGVPVFVLEQVVRNLILY